nr:putative ribonuclease H-like domain-containing protein [Tanacetum cinerariifolium]
MGYLVRAYYSISSTRYYKDDSCWSADVKSKTTEDIISDRSFMEVLVLNHYVLAKNVLFSWVFFLATKDETSKVLKSFITTIENQINKKVKVIRCDNGTEFKNRDLDEFCGMKWIKREYSNARTLQQNRVTDRKNRTLIKAARTMLVDSLLPVTFWAKAVNTGCYVLNRDLVTKTHNKTLYELLNGRSHRLDFMRPFGCHVTILNTLGPLGNIEGKADEGFLVGYCRKHINDDPVASGAQTW